MLFDKFVINRMPIFLPEYTQNFSFNLEYSRECAVRPAKMLEIVRRHTLVERIKKSSLPVVCIDCRHRMPAPHHFVCKRNIDLRCTASIPNHFRKIRKQDSHIVLSFHLLSFVCNQF